MDDKIIGLYAAGLSVRDIQAHLEDPYGRRVSPDLISRVTDAVLEEVRDCQHRALDLMYPIVFFDALRVRSATLTTGWSGIRRSTSPWASSTTASVRSSVFESPTTKAPNSGSQ